VEALHRFGRRPGLLNQKTLVCKVFRHDHSDQCLIFDKQDPVLTLATKAWPACGPGPLVY
jgi:hypothetical protein